MSTWRYLILLMLPMALLPGMLQAQSVALADFDDSGTVSFADFILFAQTFGSGQTRYDLDGSGTVNFPDFVAFSQVFGGKVGSGIVETFSLPGGETLKMVWIEPGTFKMGSPDTEPGREDDEGPQHAVTISRGFYLGKHEVTQRQWEEVVGTRPWIGKNFVRDHPDHPAAYVVVTNLFGPCATMTYEDKNGHLAAFVHCIGPFLLPDFIKSAEISTFLGSRGVWKN